MKTILFLLTICLLSIAAQSQISIVDSTQTIAVGKAERLVPLGSAYFTKYVKGTDTTYTFTYKSEGSTDKVVTIPFTATTQAFEELYKIFESAFVNDKTITINFVLGQVPVTITNNIRGALVRCDVTINNISFLLTRQQLRDLFNKK